MVGRERERERPRHGIGEWKLGTAQARDHQAKPSGARCIISNSHNLNFFKLSILPDASSCVLLGRPAETGSVKGQRRIILPEISYISLCHEGPTTAKELQLILWKVFFHKFWYFIKNNRSTVMWKVFSLYCVLDFIFHLPFILTPKTIFYS